MFSMRHCCYALLIAATPIFSMLRQRHICFAEAIISRFRLLPPPPCYAIHAAMLIRHADSERHATIRAIRHAMPPYAIFRHTPDTPFSRHMPPPLIVIDAATAEMSLMPLRRAMLPQRHMPMSRHTLPIRAMALLMLRHYAALFFFSPCRQRH